MDLMVGMQRSVLGLIAAVTVVAAAAWAAPPAAVAQDVPSYATPVTLSTDETIHGRIRSVDGAFSITVADDRGFIDTVSLHAGTIINPTGLTLSAGMSVTILGYNAGASFSANEIDTPYTYSGPLPVPVYYGSGYWYPGFAYGYGPSFGLAIVFGGGYAGSWHYEHCGFYGRPWNGHAYFGSYVGSVPLSHGAGRYALGATPAHAAVSVHAAATHAPPAFAGRTFAGESRRYTAERDAGAQERSEHVFSSESTSRQPARDFAEVQHGGDSAATTVHGASSRGGSAGGSRGAGGSHGGASSHGGGGSGRAH
jgi:uncharacterized membrane protein YgcG